MTTLLLILILLILAGIAWKVFMGGDNSQAGSFEFLQREIHNLHKTVDDKMGKTRDSVERQYHASQRIIQDVTEKLTKLDETNKQVISFTDQLQSLQRVLNNPKQRGVLGEYFLERVLQDVLPPGSYDVQHKIGKTDDSKDLIVDAVVFVRDQKVPIDAKFSLENYNRMIDTEDATERLSLEKQFVNDLKDRIKETAKYIRPEEGTTEFAFMFLPSEGIYYDLLSNKVGAIKDENNLIQRAANQYKVIIVSPTTFLAYLQTVLQGLNAMKIESQAKDIIKRVGELGMHLKKYEEFLGKLGNSLGTTVNHYKRVSKEFNKIDKDVLRISGESPGLETPDVNHPED